MILSKNRLRQLAGLLTEQIEEVEEEGTAELEEDLDFDVGMPGPEDKTGKKPLKPEEFEIDEAMFSEMGLDDDPDDVVMMMDPDDETVFSDDKFFGKRLGKTSDYKDWDGPEAGPYGEDPEFDWEMDELLDDNEATASNVLSDPSKLEKRTRNFDAKDEGLSMRDRKNKSRTDPFFGSDVDYDEDNLGELYGAKDKYADIDEPDSMRVDKDPFSFKGL